MRLSVEVPRGTLGRILNRWERVQAVRLQQGEDGRMTLLLSYDLGETMQVEAQSLFDEMDARAA